jgi:hypothetical protein
VDNIKIDLRQIGWVGMDWIDLAEDRGWVGMDWIDLAQDRDQ